MKVDKGEVVLSFKVTKVFRLKTEKDLQDWGLKLPMFIFSKSMGDFKSDTTLLTNNQQSIFVQGYS